MIIFFIINICIHFNIIHIFLVVLFFLVGVNSGDLIHLFDITSEILANAMKGEVDVVVEAILFEFGDLTLFQLLLSS